MIPMPFQNKQNPSSIKTLFEKHGNSKSASLSINTTIVFIYNFATSYRVLCAIVANSPSDLFLIQKKR